jgi:ubiquinone/menaquinone biosynthesis C-methylase UbiE
MNPLNLDDPAKIKAAAVYNSASDHFDDAPLAFWDVFGRRTVERLALRSGMTVLDVGCGTGASALPAAEIVGPSGRVIGVDLAENLLALGQAKASDRHLNQITFRLADMMALEYSDEYFDAVISVFSIFFLPHMEATVRELWRMVKPGGILAVTTWGVDFFAPAYEVWRKVVREQRPDLFVEFNPWDKLTSAESLDVLLQAGGAHQIEIFAEQGQQLLQSPEDWWTIVLGSGLRGVVDAMNEETKLRTHDQTVGWVHQHGVKSIQTNVIYAIARKLKTE